MAPDRIKTDGVHYTPAAVADFLAAVTVAACESPEEDSLEVLDPACGDGALLFAFANQWPPSARPRLVLHGYETDPHALGNARRLLATTGVREVRLARVDFLAMSGFDGRPSGRRATAAAALARFDAIIANPPYVRTQVLGAARAQALAARFGLTGRVDLYQAFAKAMAAVLRPGGVLGLLASNRLLTVKSGTATRHLLRSQFALAAIYDLGDTRLFSAAVLPVIVVARKQSAGGSAVCSFDRVYRCRSKAPHTAGERAYPAVIEAFRDRRVRGIIATNAGRFEIERGILPATAGDEPWCLSTPGGQQWLQTIQAQRRYAFADVAHIRVGIKTTADEVFIRDDWESLPTDEQPENELLRPLLTHSSARRWIAISPPKPPRLLYPYAVRGGKRVAVDLAQYPLARAYLESHRQRLSRRQYVLDAGRQWHEIWVPHHPWDWAKPKIVFPDIAEEPRFFLDSSGALANGDCYWITLRPGWDQDWLYLMLAIANSSFITKYYDVVFHNKLYAGRRRFMTQYVRTFPLPDLSTPGSRALVALVAQLVKRQPRDGDLERRVDELVWQGFGLARGLGSNGK